jgi:hypothetical protein
LYRLRRGAILNSDFRRVIAELNVAVDDASYSNVAASCAFDAEEAHPGGAVYTFNIIQL